MIVTRTKHGVFATRPDPFQRTTKTVISHRYSLNPSKDRSLYSILFLTANNEKKTARHGQLQDVIYPSKVGMGLVLAAVETHCSQKLVPIPPPPGDRII